jgi:hypothetical protein
MAYQNIREEELKNRVAQDYFSVFDCTGIIGNIDFSVKIKNTAEKLDFSDEYLLWAEAKAGNKKDLYESFTQLILTIGKARTFGKRLPPSFLGAFDADKIAFIPYNEIQGIIHQNDFNWNVTPSDHETKEFRQVYTQVKNSIENSSMLFCFDTDEKDLRAFIKANFIAGKFNATKIQIDKNNFITVYNKWLGSVKPTIAVDWDIVKRNNIIDGDFYLADLLSEKNTTLKENLFVVLKATHYEANRHIDTFGMFTSSTISFKDKQKAHTQFWNTYERPPKADYWDYIIERRDLLVPQDVRERKGSFFTPCIWVELSQKYIADVFGQDWQNEYHVWDCAAGTGNLLAGLTNKYNIWASTLDKQDVDVMHDRIDNGANLLKEHVFQFDFLNDDFAKLPEGLKKIIDDEKKRKKLIIYINPPYAEASNKRTLEGGTEGNRGVEQSLVNKKYAKLLGQGNAELFVQFLTRIYCEMPGVVLSEFSKLKILTGQHFINFREFYQAKLEKAFVVPANTFDNVKGAFPVGFMIWNTNEKQRITDVVADVYDKNGNYIGTKCFSAYCDSQYINDWIKPLRGKKNEMLIGKFPFKGNDFQNQNLIAVVHPEMDYNTEAGQFLINPDNLIEACIYFSVRKCIDATWLNDRDQFLYPNDGWQTDTDFQNDCLAFTLFHGQNRISSKDGINHWIPFTEYQVVARNNFDSHFMTDFIAGKAQSDIVSEPLLFYNNDFGGASVTKCNSDMRNTPLQFSPQATVVFDTGRALWKYYHAQSACNVNASLYDIREYFQGRDEKGKMNSASEDETYTALIKELRDNIRLLATKIEPKVYEYGFLKE